MKTTLPLVLLFLLGLQTSIYATGTDSTNSGDPNVYTFTVTPQYNFKNLGLESSGLNPSKIEIGHTNSFKFGFNYERITKTGFVFGGDLSLGLIHQDLTFFDNMDWAYLINSTTDPEFKQAIATLKSLPFYSPLDYPFLEVTPKIGYVHKIGRKWSAEGTIGINLRMLLSTPGQTLYGEFILYHQEYYKFADVGRGYHPGDDIDEGLSALGNFYIGVRRKLKGSIRYFTIGLEATHSLAKKVGTTYPMTVNFYDLTGKKVGENNYYGRDFTIGIRIGFGFGSGSGPRGVIFKPTPVDPETL